MLRMAEACTATGGCKLGPRSQMLGRTGTGAATPKFRLPVCRETRRQDSHHCFLLLLLLQR
jgi:hypothetical protein